MHFVKQERRKHKQVTLDLIQLRDVFLSDYFQSCYSGQDSVTADVSSVRSGSGGQIFAFAQRLLSLSV